MSTTVANQHTECASELALAMPIASNFQERPSRGIEYEVALAERLQSGVEVLLRVTAGTGNQIGDMFDAINDCRSHLREDLRALHQNADASGDYDHLEQQQRDAGTVALLHLQQQATSTVQEILNRTELALRGTDIDLGSSRLTVVLERYHLAVASHLETIQAPLAPLLVLGSKAPEIVDPPRASSSFDAAHEVLCELSKTLVKAQKQIINDAVQQGGTTPSDVPEDGAAIATLDVGYVRTSVGMPDDLRLARDNLRVAIGYLQYTESLVEKELNAYGTIKNSLGIVHNAIPILGHLSVHHTCSQR